MVTVTKEQSGYQFYHVTAKAIPSMGPPILPFGKEVSFSASTLVNT